MRARLGSAEGGARRDVYFFFNDTPPTEIYTLSLHDALPISDKKSRRPPSRSRARRACASASTGLPVPDRKSTRLNSSHITISYAVFCLKKKIKNKSKTNSKKNNINIYQIIH